MTVRPRTRSSGLYAQGQQGLDLATLPSILGHNSIRIGQRYVHMDEHKRAAIER